MKFTKQTIYIGLFAILYLIVAFSSFWHACAFFGLANNSWMSIILAFAFEIGQAAVLFSLLTSKKDRSRVMPWVLMTMFTLVQVIGNVFSSYKYIISNSVENLRYFKEPIFIWTQLPDDQATVIVTYVVGAILPIAALLLTSMITNYLSDKEEEKKNELEQPVEEQKVEKITGTDSDGGVIGEQGEDGSKFIPTPATTEDIEKLKQELEELKHPKIKQIPSYEIIHNQPIEKHDIEENNSDGQTDKTEDTDGNNGGEQQEDKKETEQEDTTVIEKLNLEKDPQPPIELKTDNIEEENKETSKKDISESDLKQAEQLMNIGFKNSSKPKKESHFIN